MNLGELLLNVVLFVIGFPIILAMFVLFLMVVRGAAAPHRIRNRAIERRYRR